MLLLNKIDLVSERTLDRLSARIRRMNPLARIVRTRDCERPLNELIGVRAFDLSRALTVDPKLFDDTDHQHDASVTSVCFRRQGVVDDAKLSRWLMQLGQERGNDLYRIKGILNVNDKRRRFVLHGVHMLLDGRACLGEPARRAPIKCSSARRSITRRCSARSTLASKTALCR